MNRHLRNSRATDDGLPPCQTEDDRFPYRGFGGLRSYCYLRIWTQLPAGEVIVMVTELPDNPGTSVTNVAETLWALIDLEYAGILSGAKIVHRIEHYPPDTLLGSHRYDGVNAERPGRDRWRPMTIETVRRLLGATSEAAA